MSRKSPNQGQGQGRESNLTTEARRKGGEHSQQNRMNAHDESKNQSNKKDENQRKSKDERGY